MKNKVITIILLISIILLIVALVFGIEIGSFTALSISDAKEKNEQLNQKIETATRMTTISYEESISKLNNNYESYLLKREEYEQLAGFTTDENKKSIFETKQYDISYLWKTLGKYAAVHNVGIEIDVKVNNAQQNLYDLNFKLSGQYVNISEFITDIENDSDFYFRIYNFKMSGREIVNATFTVKNIMLDQRTLTAAVTGGQQ